MQLQAEVVTLEKVIADTWDQLIKPLPPSLQHLELECMRHADASPSVAGAEIVERPAVDSEPEPY